MARRLMTLRLSEQAIARLDALAVEHGVTRSVVLREALGAGEDLVADRLAKRKARDEAESRMP